MAFDAFIKIDGIDGESNDSLHNGWIEVIHYALGQKQTVSTAASTAGGASAERASFQDFSFSKLLDKATPKLTFACAAGTHIDKIIVELCRSGTEKVTFMKYELTNNLISSVKTSSGDPNNSFPVDLVSINFGKIEWGHTQQKRRGGMAAGQIAGGWNLQRNCKI